MTTQQMNEVPVGYMLNAAGHLVPESQVREHDKLRDNIARDIAEQAIEINARLKQFKKHALQDLADLVSMSAENYGVSIGGKKGNISVTTYDGEYKVTRTMAERLTFTEELEAAKELVNSCIDRWSAGADGNIRALVNRAFKANGKGQIKTTAILDLLRLEIEDDEWQRAMEALKDSIQTTGTAIYVRVYKRIPCTDEYLAVPLDLAAINVTEE
jgi:hypothetical protein